MDIKLSENGSTLVELTVALFAFLFVLIGFSEMARVSFQKLAIEHSIHTTTRYAVTGISEEGHTMEESIKMRLNQVASSYGLNLSDAAISICPVGKTCIDEDGVKYDNAGEQNEFVEITVTKPYSTIFALFNRSVTSSVIARNEPF